MPIPRLRQSSPNALVFGRAPGVGAGEAERERSVARAEGRRAAGEEAREGATRAQVGA